MTIIGKGSSVMPMQPVGRICENDAEATILRLMEENRKLHVENEQWANQFEKLLDDNNQKFQKNKELKLEVDRLAAEIIRLTVVPL